MLMVGMMHNVEDKCCMSLIQELKQILIVSCKKSIGCGNDTTWTDNIINGFKEFSDQNNYCFYSKKNPIEWLYDITICKKNNESIEETILVVESEWKKDFGSIIYDFRKLLLCNSKVKVMIFSQANIKKQDELFLNMKDEIKCYKNCNGLFLLACFVDGNDFTFDTFDCSKELEIK